jgi:hypothetical protein
MRRLRRLLLCLVLFFIAASAATGVHASTDCERWFIAYKNSLAKAKAVKKLQAAKHRMRRYVHKKLATAQKPADKPKLVRTHMRPRMSRAEMLRRFNLACGELPEESAAPQQVATEELAPDFFPRNTTHSDMPLEDTPGTGLIAENDSPPYSPGGSGGWPGPPSGGIPPGFGGGFGGGGTTPSYPGTPGTPIDPVTPVTPAVPEPSSIVLLLTGAAGAAGMIRRRIQRQV